jgi:hypothetical protein
MPHPHGPEVVNLRRDFTTLDLDGFAYTLNGLVARGKHNGDVVASIGVKDQREVVVCSAAVAGV